MFLTGAAVNLLLGVAGGVLGSLIKKGIPKRFSDTVLHGMALCVIYIGLADLVNYVTVYSRGEGVSSLHVLIPILSMAIGGVLGEWIDIDRQMNRFASFLQRKLDKGGKSRMAEGFMTASVLFCVGAMSIVGSLRSGMFFDHRILIAKSVIDGIVGFVLATSFGVGVALAGVTAFVYEGVLSTGAYFLGRAMVGDGATAETVSATLSAMPAINEMTCVGALLIVGIGLNMLGVCKIRVVNFLPALVLPFLLCLIF